MINSKDIRQQFPIFLNTEKKYIFFDNASTTLKPRCVIDAINEYNTKTTANSHRGDYDFAYNVDLKVEQTRKLVAQFINANENEIVFTSGTTNSLNLIAYGYALRTLKKDDEIIISELEHASNVLPWFKVREVTGCIIKFVPLDNEHKITVENFKSVLSKKTKIVSLANISNVLGLEVDMKSISKLAHEVGAIVICDAAQSIAHKKIDVRDLDVDFLAFSAHKMYGPTGIGILYGKFDLLKQTDPFLFGGGMNTYFKKDLEVGYYPPPTKFEAGTLNLEGIFGLNACIKFIMDIGIENIEKYENDLIKYLKEKICLNKEVQVYNMSSKTSILTFNYNDVFAQDFATYLNSKGIAVRSGHHCAKLLNPLLNTLASVRVSLSIYNTKDEIDELVEACLHGGDFLDAYFN